jgi:hypothetical protein
MTFDLQAREPASEPDTIPIHASVDKRKRRLIISIVAVVLVLLPASIFVWSQNSKDVGKFAGIPAKAISVCRERVKIMLRSPATAQFSGENVKWSASVPGKFLIVDSVDAQNGYGALIRNAYVCSGQYTEVSNTAVATDAMLIADDDDLIQSARFRMEDQVASYVPIHGTCGLNYIKACVD